MMKKVGEGLTGRKGRSEWNKLPESPESANSNAQHFSHEAGSAHRQEVQRTLCT